MKSLLKRLLREEIGLLVEITVNDAWVKFYSDKTKFPTLNGDVNLFNELNSLYSEDGKNFNKGVFNWLYSLRKNGALKDEDFYKAKEYIKFFKKFINKIPKENRDLTKFKNLGDLYSVVKEFIEGDENAPTSNTQEIKQIKQNEIKKVFEDDDWSIMIPLTERASCLIGKGTQWCTAADNSNNYFNHYNNDGPLYVIIDKKERSDSPKYQLHFESEQIMDERDRDVGMLYFFENIVDGSVLEYFEKNIPNFWEFILKAGASDYADSGYSDLFQEALSNVKEGNLLESVLSTLRSGNDRNAVSDGFFREKDPNNISSHDIENLIRVDSEDNNDYGDDNSVVQDVFNYLVKIGYDFYFDNNFKYTDENNIIKIYLKGNELLNHHKLEIKKPYKIDKGRTLKILSIKYTSEEPKFKIEISNKKNTKTGNVDIETLLNLLHNHQLFESKRLIKTTLRLKLIK